MNHKDGISHCCWMNQPQMLELLINHPSFTPYSSKRVKHWISVSEKECLIVWAKNPRLKQMEKIRNGILFRVACSLGCLETVQLLFQENVDIHLENDLAMTSAIEGGQKEIVSFLLSKSNYDMNQFTSSIYISFLLNKESFVLWTLKTFPDLDFCNMYQNCPGWSPTDLSHHLYFEMINKNQWDLLKKLLEYSKHRNCDHSIHQIEQYYPILLSINFEPWDIYSQFKHALDKWKNQKDKSKFIEFIESIKC